MIRFGWMRVVLTALNIGLALPAGAAVVLQDGGVHQLTTDLNDAIVIDSAAPASGSTTVILSSSGVVNHAVLNNDGTLRIAGGRLSSTFFGVSAYDRSQFDMSAGQIQGTAGIMLAQRSTGRISGGSVNGGVVAYHSSSVRIDGGNFAGGVMLYNDGATSISGGSFGGGLTVYADADSSITGGAFSRGMTLYGGMTTLAGGHFSGAAMIYDGAELDWHGGDFGSNLVLYDGYLDVFGYDLTLSARGGNRWGLTGTFGSGAAFDKDIYLSGSLTTAANVRLHDLNLANAVPEPGSAALIGLSLALLGGYTRRAQRP